VAAVCCQCNEQNAVDANQVVRTHAFRQSTLLGTHNPCMHRRFIPPPKRQAGPRTLRQHVVCLPGTCIVDVCIYSNVFCNQFCDSSNCCLLRNVFHLSRLVDSLVCTCRECYERVCMSCTIEPQRSATRYTKFVMVGNFQFRDATEILRF
jgi:hypothetical protein